MQDSTPPLTQPLLARGREAEEHGARGRGAAPSPQTKGKALHPRFTDVNQTLKFDKHKLGVFYLLTGVVCLALGILGVSYDTSVERKPILYGMVVLGFALSGYGLHRTFNSGKPLLVISPSGIALDIEFVKTIFVPWQEVHRVQKTSKDTVSVAVSKNFYNRAIHVSNLFLRGPGWSEAFADYGDTVEIRLSSKVVPASVDELLAALDTRWNAFVNTKPDPGKTGNVHARGTSQA